MSITDAVFDCIVGLAGPDIMLGRPNYNRKMRRMKNLALTSTVLVAAMAFTPMGADACSYSRGVHNGGFQHSGYGHRYGYGVGLAGAGFRHNGYGHDYGYDYGRRYGGGAGPGPMNGAAIGSSLSGGGPGGFGLLNGAPIGSSLSGGYGSYGY